MRKPNDNLSAKIDDTPSLRRARALLRLVAALGVASIAVVALTLDSMQIQGAGDGAPGPLRVVAVLGLIAVGIGVPLDLFKCATGRSWSDHCFVARALVVVGGCPLGFALALVLLDAVSL